MLVSVLVLVVLLFAAVLFALAAWISTSLVDRLVAAGLLFLALASLIPALVALGH